jgi:hypothetical protein
VNGLYRPATNTVGIATNSLQRLLIDSNGRIAVNHSALINVGTATPRLQTHDTTESAIFASNSVFAWNNSLAGGSFAVHKSRSATIGTYGIVQNGDTIAQLRGFADNGSDFVLVSQINTEIDGAVTATDMPTRMRFFTRNTGDVNALERMRLSPTGDLIVGATTSDHRFRVNGTIQCDATLRIGTTFTRNAVPVNSNVSTTATAASLLTGIRTGTPAAGIDLQMPTGTDLDAAFVSLANNQTLEWTVINLASATHAITVTANTDHTVVGNMVVAANSSARFASRKTAANTFITYRIGS